ncbi:hypothetical protein [Nitrincola alkalisediminis]|uniref:hypothetical protein n=1 Tax=Nitrincola alkalisediminis TaxID=1366656 RepID=UPI00187368AB|nr:hypothetical protein [Nitrincola alkalisediminis]
MKRYVGISTEIICSVFTVNRMVVMSRQFLLIGSLAQSLSACQDVSRESKASFAISASDQLTEVSTMACREFNDGLV